MPAGMRQKIEKQGEQQEQARQYLVAWQIDADEFLSFHFVLALPN